MHARVCFTCVFVYIYIRLITTQYICTRVCVLYVCLHTFVPLAYELYGGRGEAAELWFKGIQSRRHNRLCQESTDATWSASTFGSYWTQRIVCAMKRTMGFHMAMHAQQDFVHR